MSEQDEVDDIEILASNYKRTKVRNYWTTLQREQPIIISFLFNFTERHRIKSKINWIGMKYYYNFSEDAIEYLKLFAKFYYDRLARDSQRDREPERQRTELWNQKFYSGMGPYNPYEEFDFDLDE